MGLISKVVKIGIAKKLYDEARKPENQRKAREAYAKFQAGRTKRR
jgi:PHD/YefM family antitoxin component YafN of YafNO toxin-antitoxin module